MEVEFLNSCIKSHVSSLCAASFIWTVPFGARLALLPYGLRIR